MQTIDFLPNRYRERSAKRRSKFWQLGVMCLFGTIIATSAVGQQLIHRNVQRQVEAIGFEHAVALANEQMLRQRQKKLNETRATANLYAYLEQRWPRTQILRAVAGDLPASVRLTEVTISKKLEKQESGRVSRRGRRENDGDEEHALPPLADLKELRRADENTDLMVLLIGVTSDAGDLYQLVSLLGESSLFEKAELVSLDSIDDRRLRGKFEFRVQILVRSGHAPPPGEQVTFNLNDGQRTQGRTR